jgi:hypothetical protein
VRGVLINGSKRLDQMAGRDVDQGRQQHGHGLPKVISVGTFDLGKPYPPVGPDEAEPVVTQILHARRALPGQWLPSLTVRRVADG